MNRASTRSTYPPQNGEGEVTKIELKARVLPLAAIFARQQENRAHR